MMNHYDVLIIGGGAAGCAAALSCRSRGKQTAIIANPVETTALFKAERITNYPGTALEEGSALARQMLSQAKAAGTVIIPGRALSVMPFDGSFGVAVGNDYYTCLAVILAVGITREKRYPGEDEYLGRGVSYCATCDGMLYRGKTVALIGNNEEAGQDADFLRSIGCEVLEFRENGKYEIRGAAKAETLLYQGKEYPVSCVFIIKDSISVAQLVPGIESVDGAIPVDRSMATAVPGVFAAGDCTGKPLQLGKAVGEGNVAALAACRYVDVLGTEQLL